MSWHVHINDEAGHWNCQGPFKDEDGALKEIERIVEKRQDGPWKRVRGTNRWIKKNTDHYIEAVSK